MTPDYTDPHLKLTTAARALIQQAKANGLSSTDATRQAEEALRGVDLDEAATFAEKVVMVCSSTADGKPRLWFRCSSGGQVLLDQDNGSFGIGWVRESVAAALRDFASAEVERARKECAKQPEPPPAQPPAVEGDFNLLGTEFGTWVGSYKQAADGSQEARDALIGLQSYCRSAARAAEERGRREEREACARLAEGMRLNQPWFQYKGSVEHYIRERSKEQA